MTLAEALYQAAQQLTGAGIATARLDAELLLAYVIQKDRTWLFTHIHEGLDQKSEPRFRELIDRRAGREPLQYILARQEFWGLEFRVTPDVLVPRPETELIVEAAIRSLETASSPTIIDLCTGSGCIAVSLAKSFGSSRIFATDMSEQALAVARENARMHGVSEQIRFFQGDLFLPLLELDIHGQVDVITANPPYIETAALNSLQPEIRDFEPELALIAGPAGTEVHERIMSGAYSFLKRNGSLMMEMGIGQADTLVALAKATGAYAKPEVLRDLAGIDRIIILEKR